MRLLSLTHRHPGGATLGPLTLEGPDDRPWLILGRRGSGKTTLLRLLGGVLSPRSGRIEGVGPDLRVYLPQFPERALAGRNLAEDLSGSVRPATNLRTRLREVLESVGIEGIPLSRRSRTLSAGERRRVALALLLLGPGRGWALDEPDAGLDARGAAVVPGLLGDALAQGRRVWIASHRPELFAGLHPHCLVLEGGRLAGSGDLRVVLGDPGLRRAAGQGSRPGLRIGNALAALRPDLTADLEKTLRKFEVPIPQVQEILTDSATLR